MHFDPRDPKSYVLYSMMTEDTDAEPDGGPGCGCPAAGLAVLSVLVLGLLAALRI